MLKMPQHHALDRFGGKRDRPRADQSREEAKRQATEAAQMIAAAAAYTSPFEFRCEQGSVTLLVGNEFFNFLQDRRRSPACNPTLSSINRNRAMLARMVDLEHDFAGRARRSQTRLIHSSEAYRPALQLQRLGTAETSAL